MRNLRLVLQYDGTDYSGWQIQKQETTIQGLLEEALFRITNENVRVTGASRTDAGVHAIHQVAVFKTSSHLAPHVFLRAVNANLPGDVRVINAEECPADFHPRYGARFKIYSYLLSFHGPHAVFLTRYSWNVPYTTDVQAMRKAARFLIGEHDFSSFRASGCSSKHPVRSIESITIFDLSSIEFMSFSCDVPAVKISIKATAFLRHMVRNIVGTLVDIGRGMMPPEKMEDIMNAKDRCRAGPTAPARGLFLEEIEY